MKKLLLGLFSVALLLGACQPKEKSPIVTKTEEEDGAKVEYQLDTVKGVKEGFYKIYHADGKTVSIERNYKNDQMDGQEKVYFESGKLKVEATYAEGALEGPFKEYFEDGKVMQEGTYKANNLEGELKTYYPNGQLKDIATMSESIENGPFEEYFDNGKLKAKGTFANGKNTENCILELYKEDASGELEKKMLCNGKGMCCTVWTAKDGEQIPSTNPCKDAYEALVKACNAAAAQ